MSQVALYFDDDYADQSVRRALLDAGLRVTWSDEQGMRGATDEAHLERATALDSVLFSANIQDFMELHSRWLSSGRHHAGLLLVVQQRWSQGELIRRIGRFALEIAPADMIDRVEFLGAWG